MLFSKLLAPTLREVPQDAETRSHQLMLKAGLIRKIASGIYSFLPLGFLALNKVIGIVREEMNRVGGQELLMPALLPSEPFQTTGKWETFGEEMFRLKDRKNRDFCLGPTHEEIFILHAKNEVHSYKELPLLLYQIQTKYRDEIRPRFGVIRAREFLMKDLYSFDRDMQGMEESYKKIVEAYKKVFERCGLKYKIAEADPGAIGGFLSHEFVIPDMIGECNFVYCKNCGYTANTDVARSSEESITCLLYTSDAADE